MRCATKAKREKKQAKGQVKGGAKSKGKGKGKGKGKSKTLKTKRSETQPCEDDNDGDVAMEAVAGDVNVNSVNSVNSESDQLEPPASEPETTVPAHDGADLPLTLPVVPILDGQPAITSQPEAAPEAELVVEPPGSSRARAC